MDEYRNYKPGDYPEPIDRRTSKDFPSAQDLFVYGYDYPMPESLEELRYEYPEIDYLVFPQAVYGFKVPPFGLSSIGKGGSGHKQGFVYGNGTFFPDTVSIDTIGGASQKDIQIARAERKQNAILEGITEALEEGGKGANLNGDADALKAFAKVVTTAALKEDAPLREKRMWFNDIYKLFSTQDEIIEKQNSIERALAKLGVDDLSMLDLALAEAIRNKAVDGEWEDVGEVEHEPLGFDLDGDDED